MSLATQHAPPGWTTGYLGLPFALGSDGPDAYDCWGLARRALREQYGIETPALKSMRGGQIPEQVEAGSRGWRQVPTSEARGGDVLGLRGHGPGLHVGLVVAPGWMLHTAIGHVSRLDRYERAPYSGLILGAWRYVGEGAGEDVASERPGAIAGLGALLASVAYQVVVNGIVMYGLGLLAKALAPPGPRDPDELRTGIRRQAFGERDVQGQYQSGMCVLGEHRVFPAHVSQPYNKVEGGKLYAYYLWTCGVGPVGFRNVRIGEDPVFDDDGEIISYRTAMTGFRGTFGGAIEMEFVQGLPADDNYEPLFYSTNVEQAHVGKRIRQSQGWSSYRRTPRDVTSFQVIVSFPKGLYWIRDSGKITSARVKLDVQYMPVTDAVETGKWLNGGKINRSAKSPDAIYAEATVSGLTAGEYRVRVRRVTKDSAATGIIDDSHWDAIVGTKSGSPVSQPDTSLISARVKIGNEFPSGLDGLNVVVRSLQTIHEGATGWSASAKASTYAPDLFRAVLQGKGSARPAADSEIDLDTLADWKVHCVAQRLRYSTVIRVGESRTVEAVLREIAASGKASLTRIDGKYSVVQDNPLAGGGLQSGTIATVATSGTDTTGVTVTKACVMETGKSYALRYQTSAGGWRYHPVDLDTTANGTKTLVFTTAIDTNDQPPSVSDAFTFGLAGAPVQLFAPSNSWGFSTERQFAIQPEGLKVGYVALDNTAEEPTVDSYREDDVVVPQEGYTIATADVLDTLDLPGVVGMHPAAKLGKYHLAQMRHRASVHTLSVDWEAMNVVRGDWVRVQHDVITEGITSGVIKSLTTDGSDNVTAITVDEGCTMTVGTRYGLLIRNADPAKSRLHNPQGVVDATGTFTTLTLLVAIPAAQSPSVGDVFAFVALLSSAGDYRVHRVTRQSEYGAQLLLVPAARERINALYLEALEATVQGVASASDDTPASRALGTVPVTAVASNAGPSAPPAGGATAGITIAIPPTRKKRKKKARKAGRK